MQADTSGFGAATETATGPEGQRAHRDHIAHSEKLEMKLYEVGQHAWSLVGNGLSNQSFVEGPEGIIAIDTGECIEEMAEALTLLREKTDKPVVACIYTHFHYVGGTRALVSEGEELPIWGHAGIEANLRRFGGEVGPRGARGLVHQFGVMMPEDGPDGLVNVGLGRFFRNPRHAPYTNGYIPAQHTFDVPLETEIAGLEVHFYPAPSDATDSVTIWFPELGLAVNNLLWPALFNVFAIRGEEYRDPRILLKGLDQLHELGAEDLIGAHGPPIRGGQQVAECIRNYRDSIQFLWDQTVRGANLGLTLDELINFVELPEAFNQHYTTRQFYGVVEHHIKQIYTGLFGWFDEDESHLFPVPSPDRHRRLIEGFGGAEEVRRQIDQALASEDFRWAAELATWLVRSDINDRGRADAGEAADRSRLASALRGFASTTISANVRNWCITRALELDGAINLERFRGHRFRTTDVLSQPLEQSAALLRVVLDPAAAAGMDQSLGIQVDDSEVVLRVRNCVALIDATKKPHATVTMSKETWAKVLGGKLALSQALESGSAETDDSSEVRRFFSWFDVATLRG